jgi:hypothetical protein
MMSRLRHPYVMSTVGVFFVLLITLLVVDRPVKSEREIQKRVALGKKPTLKHHVPVWLWRGLCVNVGLAGVLVALAPLASRRVTRSALDGPEHRLKVGEWLMVATAAGVFALSAAPRLSHSLWGDEENLMQTCIADQVTLNADGSVSIAPTAWIETLWNYDRPTNHMGYTVVARLFHEALYSPGSGATDAFFSETAVRLPVLLSGLGWFWAMAWCCMVWGWARGVAPVALALAGHAWMVRYGVDARGYGFVVLLVFLLVGLLGRALQTGAWRWWLGYGLAQFYLLWVHPGAIHAPVMLNLTAVVMVFSDSDKSARLVLAGRWMVANLCTAMLVIGVMAPILTPFIAFLKRRALAGSLDLDWFQDAASYLLVGAPWFSWGAGNRFSTSLRDGALLSWEWMLVFLVLLSALAGVGIWRVVRERRTVALPLFLIGGPALMILHAVVGETRPYQWYLLPFFPALCLLWVIALAGFKRRALWSAGAFLVAGVHLSAWNQSKLLQEAPIESIRESVALTRKITNPRHPDYNKGVMTAASVMNPGCYDPGAWRFNSVDELRVLMNKADGSRVPLFVNFGFRGLYETMPDVLRLLDDPQLFERVAVLPGQFVSTTREVVRYRGTARH